MRRLAFALALGALYATTARAQVAAFGVCKPVSARTQPLGCWILTDHGVGRFDDQDVYWHLDAYPTRAAAEAQRGARGTVVDALGRSWLLTIENAGWRPTQPGEHVAIIGPLRIVPGTEYSATYMEAVMTPGMTSAVHRHSGPEAWYTVSGETCLETPDSIIVGSAGHPAIVPSGPPMFLTAIGNEQRRALVLILHDAAQAATTMEHDWKPKLLCAKHK